MLDSAAPTPDKILSSVFGFDAFRGQQADIVDHVCAGGDGLVLMPTGGGKSLCFQIPALVRPGVGVVVSPLIALMQDQVTALKQLGVRAEALNSALSYNDALDVERRMRAGELDMIYVAPERLLTDGFMNSLAACEIALFAIDEAHCVSQWGHDFRPEYLQLDALHKHFPGVPRLGLTATADGPTRSDIIEKLNLDQGRVFVSGFDRPNICYRVRPKENAKKSLLDFLSRDHGGAEGKESGIIYCGSRKKVEEMAIWLQDQGYDALAYHAGLPSEKRAANQDRFIKDDGVVMVATIAFGMGIDKPDVRFVAHMDVPKTLEAYYQETGRAGRDGLPADAWMAYGMQDAGWVRQMVENSNAPERQKHVERQKLDALLGFCETARCRRQVLLEYFNDGCEPCGNCDTCLEPVDTFDGTEVAQKALSTVYRTEQNFGAGHLIDILLGADTDKIRRFGHKDLSVFGIGKDLGKPEWRSVFRQLTALGLLRVDIEGHGALLLGADVRPVLRGEQKIELRRDRASKKARATASRRMIFTDEATEVLFQALRAKRSEFAHAQGVPPYVIFNDKTLVEMALHRPGDPYQLARINGVGEKKLDRYGDAFLAVIAETV